MYKFLYKIILNYAKTISNILLVSFYVSFNIYNICLEKRTKPNNVSPNSQYSIIFLFTHLLTHFYNNKSKFFCI